MATYQGIELYKTCPYNIHHRVAPRNLATHISKCALKSDKKLTICMFNSIHRIEPELYEAHLVVCPDNKSAVREIYKLKKWDIDDPPKPPVQQNEVNDLADKMGAARISHTPAFEGDDEDGWNAPPAAEPFLAPGLEGNLGSKLTNSFSLNTCRLQGMTKSQKKKWSNKLVVETLNRIENAKQRRERELEMSREEEIEYERQLELQAIEREKQEREEKNKMKAAKKKEQKEKVKAGKRAVYFANIEKSKEGNNE